MRDRCLHARNRVPIVPHCLIASRAAAKFFEKGIEFRAPRLFNTVRTCGRDDALVTPRDTPRAAKKLHALA